MEKPLSNNPLLNKIASFLIIGLPLVTVLFCVLIQMRFVYYWDIFWPVYRRILYVLLILILFGLLFFYSFSKNHIAFKFLVFVFTIPLFCFGSLILITVSPTILDRKQLNNHIYYLFAEGEPLKPRTLIRLLRCKTNTFECTQTSFEERADVANNFYYLMIDPKKNEVHILGKSRLYESVRLQYTYGAYPRHYDFPEQFEDQLFYLAYYYDNDPQAPRVYTIYQCELDHTYCSLLPFEYKHTGFGDLIKIQTNQSTREVNVYRQSWDSDDLEYKKKTLIYVYGDHSRCYVEGCEILEQK